MRILVLNADYLSFLTALYRGNPGLESKSFAEQRRTRLDCLLGSADAYASGFESLGHTGREIFVNNIWMQSAWAHERGMAVPDAPTAGEESLTSGTVAMWLKRRLRPYRGLLTPAAKRVGLVRSLSRAMRTILRAQIEDFNPDVIINQDIELIDAPLMRSVKRPGRIFVALHGNQPPERFAPAPYRFGLAIVPSIVDSFRAKGLPTEYHHLAFDPAVLDHLPPPPPKDIAVSFVGGLSSNHTQRIALLEAVASEFPIELYLSQFKGIPAKSPLHRYVRGEAWGRDMYQILRRSKITLNSHVDAAGGVAANMRLYEATGAGTFLLTDNLRGLPDLFTPGRHLAAYDSAADCVAKIKHYLAQDAEREAIAAAGQQHTLSHHTYRHRAEEILRLVAKYS